MLSGPKSPHPGCPLVSLSQRPKGSANLLSSLLWTVAAIIFAACPSQATPPPAPTTTPSPEALVVAKSPSLNGQATIDGDLWVLNPGSINVNGGANITGPLFVPGTPKIVKNGNGQTGPVIDGPGAVNPTNHQITVNGGAVLSSIIRRTEPRTMPVVPAPTPPAGTRNVTLNNKSDSPGNFATIRNLTLNSNVGPITVPPGVYGDFTANSQSGFILGVPRATQPAVYNFQRLTLNAHASFSIVGPVTITVANGVVLNAHVVFGDPADPCRTELRISGSGGLTLNAQSKFYGKLITPTGPLIVNAQTIFKGHFFSDRLTVNAGASIIASCAGEGGGTPPNTPPVANPVNISTPEDASVQIPLSGSDADGNPLTFAIATQPQHGSATLASNTATYTPAADYNGPDSYTFTVNDGTATSAPATVAITVTPVDEPPTAKPVRPILEGIRVEPDGSYTAYFGYKNENDTPVTIPVGSSNKFSPNPIDRGQPTLFSVGRTPYYPNAAFRVPFSAGNQVWTLKSPDGSTRTATASPSSTKLNAPPVVSITAPSPNSTFEQGTVVAFRLSANDPDPSGLVGIASVELFLQDGSRLGQASPAPLIGPHIFTFETTALPVGSISLYAKATDVQNASTNSSPLNLNITPGATNRPPVALPQAISTLEDNPVTITLAGFDPDNDALTYIIATQPDPATGIANLVGDQLTFTPAANFHGPATLTFQANDGTLSSSTATVSITVTPVNDAPTAEPTSITTNEDIAVEIPLVAIDPDGDALTFAVATQPQHGTVTITGTTATYTPATNHNGPDSFTFTATDPSSAASSPSVVPITVTPVNDAPTADPTSATTEEDIAVEIPLVATDPDGDTVTFAVATRPQHGTVTITGTTATYTPATKYNGPDSFTFTATDPSSVVSVPSVVLITINPSADQPEAADLVVTLVEDESRDFQLPASDPNGSPLKIAIHEASGEVAPQFEDGLPTISIKIVSPPDYHGRTTLRYSVINEAGVASEEAVILVTVEPVNDSPRAISEELFVKADSERLFTPKGTDIDLVDDSALRIRITRAPAFGAFQYAEEGGYVYLPNIGFLGSDSIEFEVTDPEGVKDKGTITFTVRNENSAPTGDFEILTRPGVAFGRQPLTAGEWSSFFLGLSRVAPDDTFADKLEKFIEPCIDDQFLRIDACGQAVVPKVKRPNEGDIFRFNSDEGDGSYLIQTFTVPTDTPIDIRLIGSDPDGDPVSFILTSQPRHGLLLGEGQDRIYRSNPAFQGMDSFAFRVTDGDLESEDILVLFKVSPAGWDVECGPDLQGAVGGPVSLSGRAIRLGPSIGATPLAKWTLVDGPAEPIFLRQALATDAYFPTPGVYRIKLEVRDPGTTGSDEILVTIRPSNRQPIVINPNVVLDEDSSALVTVEVFDEDGDSTVLRAKPTGAPRNGSVAQTGPNSFSYTPAHDFFGQDSFAFEVVDQFGGLTHAAATFTVEPQPDAPKPFALNYYAATGVEKPIILFAREPDGDTVTSFRILSTPTNGTLRVDEGAEPVFEGGIWRSTVHYLANAGFEGEDTFTYTATDGVLEGEPATAILQVGRSTPFVAIARDDGSAKARRFTPGLSRQISFTTTDPDNNITEVQVYLDGELVKTVTSGFGRPQTATLPPMPDRLFVEVRLKAIDATGLEYESAAGYYLYSNFPPSIDSLGLPADTVLAPGESISFTPILKDPDAAPGDLHLELEPNYPPAYGSVRIENGTVTYTANERVNRPAQEGFFLRVSDGVWTPSDFSDYSSPLQYVSITVTRGGVPPTILLTTPSASDTPARGEPLLLAATVNDPDLDLEEVRFLYKTYNAALPQEDTSWLRIDDMGTLASIPTTQTDGGALPVSFTWPTLPNGNFVLRALAIDKTGHRTYSDAVRVNAAAATTISEPRIAPGPSGQRQRCKQFSEFTLRRRP